MVNHLKDILVVNTDDAVYIGEKGQSNDLKEIILESRELWDYFNRSPLFYRKWGSYEIISEDENEGYQVRKVSVLPGKTIYLHKHAKKSENINIVSGRCKAVVGGNSFTLSPGDILAIPEQTEHQLSCISEENLVFIETAIGGEQKGDDVIAVESKDMSEASLGYEVDPFVLLKPAYKDYLWGGNKLKKYYNKKTELNPLAESWELSAHPDGQSKAIFR